MKFLDVFRPRSKPVRNGVPGTALVVSAAGYAEQSVYQRCELNLVVSAATVPPTAVEITSTVHRKRWPDVGATLPISIDPSDPQTFSILWDQVPDIRDVRRAAANDVAAAIRRDTGVPSEPEPEGP